MNFFSFIRTHRSAQEGLDQRTCNERPGIGAATPSRAENGRSRLTLRTAMLVCQGLGVSLAALMDEWLGTHAARLESVPALPGGATLTTGDVEALIERFRVNVLACSTRLADTLNGLLAAGGQKLPLFVPADAVNLLPSDSPVYRFGITYPEEVTHETLLALRSARGEVCSPSAMPVTLSRGYAGQKAKRSRT
jgi:hypothetical protein